MLLLPTEDSMWRSFFALALAALVSLTLGIDGASARPKYTVAECQDVYANCLTWCLQHNKTEASRIECGNRCKSNYLSCRAQSDTPLPPDATNHSGQVEPGTSGPFHKDPNGVPANGGVLGQ